MSKPGLNTRPAERATERPSDGKLVRERVEQVLEHIARIAASRRNLRRWLAPALGDGIKLLLWSYDRTEEWTPNLSTRPTEHGTLGLAALLNGLRIKHSLQVGEPSVEPGDDDDRGPLAQEPDRRSGDPWSEAVRQVVVRMTFYRLVDDGRPANVRRVLSLSEFADVAFLTRSFLASDIGLSEVDGAAALADLLERGLADSEWALVGYFVLTRGR